MSQTRKPKSGRASKVVAFVLVLDALACFRTVSVVGKELSRVAPARAKERAVAAIGLRLRESEMAGRVFLLTTSDPDRATVGEGLKRVRENFDALDRMTGGDPFFGTRVASLRHVILDRDELYVQMVEQRMGAGAEAAMKVLDSGRMRRDASEIRRILSEMESDLDARVRGAADSAERAAGGALLAVVPSSVVALGLLWGVSRGTRRELARREKAADEHRDGEEWLAETLDSLSDAVIATDVGDRVRLINRVALRLTGRDAEESVGRPLSEVFPLLDESTRAPMPSPAARVLGEGASVGPSNHTLLIAKDGTERPIEHAGAPIRDRRGATTGVVLCFRDVADRRRVEDELRASKELADAANRAKDQFLAVLSHELRKPLNPVLVAVSGILERDDPSELRPVLEMIRRNVEMESRLIEDLLDVSRIARGGLRLHTEIVDAHEVIREAVATCHAEVLLADIDVVLTLSAGSRHTLADETRLMQVFWNLVTNAAKFTPRGGRLEILTWNDETTGRLVIEFRDNGIGIEPGSLSRIFEPFEQGAANTRKRYGGLGLGLAISQGIVESHGGRMTAESEGRNKGATFRLDFKAVARPAQAAVPSGPPRRSLPGPARLRILLVDDNADTLRYLAAVLKQRGHEVFSADRMESARLALAEREFDLLISDIELPDGSGLDLMREARGIPGIAISGFGSDDDVDLSGSAGFATHLTKPIDVRRLDQAIAQALAASTSAPAGDER